MREKGHGWGPEGAGSEVVGAQPWPEGWGVGGWGPEG